MLLRRESCCTLTFCAFKLYALYFRRFLHAENFYRRVSFTPKCLSAQETLHPGAVGRRSFYTQMRLHICSYTQTTRQPFFTEALAHGCLYTKHAKAFTHSCCQQMFLHTEVFALTLLRIVRASAFPHSSCYARKPFTRTHRCSYTKASTYGKLLHTESFTRGGPLQTGFYLQKLLHTGAGTMHGSKKGRSGVHLVYLFRAGSADRVEVAVRLWSAS